MSDPFPAYCGGEVSESKAKAHTEKARLLKRLAEREPGGAGYISLAAGLSVGL